jgi:hypothetical protein
MVLPSDTSAIGNHDPRLDGPNAPRERSGQEMNVPIGHEDSMNLPQIHEKPVLLVDVDGVISLWGFPERMRPRGTFLSVDGIPHFLSAEAGDHLLALRSAYELVWCTGWEEKANEYLPAALGLPEPLPHLGFDSHIEAGTTMPGHWKLAAIQAYVGSDRPVAWIDDAFNEACHAWAADRPGATHLEVTDPATGLTATHASTLLAWARGVL